MANGPTIRYSCNQFGEHCLTIDADERTTYQPACACCVPHATGGRIEWTTERRESFKFVREG